MGRIVLQQLLIFLLSISSLRANVIDTLPLLTGKDRAAIISEMMKNRLLQVDSAVVAAEIGAIAAFAENKHDVRLQAVALNLKGVYHYYRIANGKEAGVKLVREAVELAEKNNFSPQIAIFGNQLGYFLCELMKYEEGLGYLLKSDHLMRQMGYENVPEVDRALYRVAKVYFDFENYDKVFHYINEALRYATAESQVHYAANNLLGITNAELKNWEKAAYHMRQSKQYATERGDSSAIAVAMSNLGLLYVEQKKFEEARPLLYEAYALKSRKKDWRNVTTALLGIIEVHLAQGDMEAAKERLKEAAVVMHKQSIRDLEGWASYYQLWSEWHEKNNNYQKANLYLDSLMDMRKTLKETRDMKLMSNLSVQLAAEKYLADIQLLEKDKLVERVVQNAMIAISILIILVLGGLLYSSIIRHRKERRNFEIAQLKAREELRNFRDRVREKNKAIESFRGQLENLKEKNGKASGVDTEQMRQQLDRFIILTEDDWLAFKKMFDKVYPNFLYEMQVRYPELTLSEMRLLALIKLNLSVSEMANTLGILPQSVRKTRQRLMKKLGLTYHKDLPHFVENM